MQTASETKPTKQSSQCTECGGGIEAGMIFCGACGKPLGSFPTCGGLTAANRPSCGMPNPAKSVYGQPDNSLQGTSEFRKSACLWAGAGILLSIIASAIFQGVIGLSGDMERRSLQALNEASITYKLSDIDPSIAPPTIADCFGTTGRFQTGQWLNQTRPTSVFRLRMRQMQSYLGLRGWL